MEAVRHAGAADLGTVVDVGLAVAGTALTALALWDPESLGGAATVYPTWLLVVLPLLIGAPLALRRRAPLVMWAATWAGILLQALVAHELPQGLEVVVLFAVC